ncbi:hypothetical protein GCM10023205_77100 [Yinghuangia aomiensis]|uniref:Uncharacterized protein n=1 Tax=Yinghuangia aomiensis TaxID=676205 RepID=A0ABP9IBJ5_9ACTN
MEDQLGDRVGVLGQAISELRSPAVLFAAFAVADDRGEVSVPGGTGRRVLEAGPARSGSTGAGRQAARPTWETCV